MMEIETHQPNGSRIAEIKSSSIVIASAQDGLDLLGNLYYQGFDKLIIHAVNITPDFFDLKDGMAGEILQKFSNYRVRLAIVGDFTQYSSKSIKDFIYESNQKRQISFVASTSEALQILGK